MNISYLVLRGIIDGRTIGRNELYLHKSLKRLENTYRELKDIFYQGDMSRISHTQEEINLVKQVDFTISSYYNKMKKLWQELDNFRHIPASNCVHD